MTALAVDLPLDLRAGWRRWRRPLAIAAFVLLAAVVLAIVENAPPARPLDPQDASAAGGRALAELARDRGVAVVAVRDVANADVSRSATVFVPDPGSLTAAELQRLEAGSAQLVVVGPGPRELDALGVDATPVGIGTDGQAVAAACAYPPAVAAGGVRYAGTGYLAASDAVQCYPQDGAAGLVLTTHGSTSVVLLGSGATLSNDWLDDEGDAALGLGLLTTSPRLLWVVPRPPSQPAADTAHRGLLDLLPSRVLWAVLQLFVVVVLVALWRGRRVGPVVVEPLPVVVRATETVEGRARLLRAARARGTAADALREAAHTRLRDRLGLSADASRDAIVEAVSRRSGWSGADVQRILYGPAPVDDAALLRLTSELDQLDRAVRHE